MPFLHALFVFSKTPSEFMNYIARKSQKYLRKKGVRKKINRVKKKINKGPTLDPIYMRGLQFWGF